MIGALFWCLATVVLVTTLLPLTNSVSWWIRMWDFPRLHIAVAALFVLLAGLTLSIPFKIPLIVLSGAAFLYQAVQIFPYTPLAATEVEMTSAPSSEIQVSLMSVNVLMENKRHDDLITIIQREDPDVLLLMETDAAWSAALQDVLAKYATVKFHVSDDHYGMIFATRLEPVNVEFLWPAQDETPALRAVLKAPNDVEFNFIGLHPRPPVPGNDTVVRDKQIKDAALMTQSSERPTICMGDFNDVAWSWTSRRFKRYGELLEPRVGRGMISSFHADYPLVRFPIDQLYVTRDVNLVSFDRLEAFGSDHFPMTATVYFAANRNAENDP